MKRALILIVAAASSYAFAQDTAKVKIRTDGPDGGVVAWGTMQKSAGPPLEGAPYSATGSNERGQPFADGNRIVQSGRRTAAPRGQGRTRQSADLPPIGADIRH